MRKLLPVALSISAILVSTTAEANFFHHLDDKLKKYDLIDENYQIIDNQRAEDFFQNLTDEARPDVLKKFDSPNAYGELVFSIDTMILSVKSKDALTEEKRLKVEKWNWPETQKKRGCSDMAYSQYAIAHDYKIIMRIFDNNDILLKEIILDKKICDSLN